MRNASGAKLIVVVIVMILAIAWLLVPRSQDQESALDVAAMRTEIAVLRGEVERLKSVQKSAQKSALAAPLEKGSRAVAADGSAGSGVATRDDASALTPMAETQDPTSGQIADFISMHYRSEVADSSWSRSAAQVVTNVLAPNLPNGSSLGGVECRRTMCEIKTSHRGMDAYEEFLKATFLSTESGLWNGGMTTLVLGDINGPIDAVTYFAREGEAVPVYEPTEGG